MKPNNKALFFLPAILLYCVFGSTEIEAQQHDLFRLKPKLSGTVYMKANRYKGSEFLLEQSLRGNVMLSNGSVAEDVSLNFNAFSNNLIYTLQGGKTITATKARIRSFVLFAPAGERRFVKTNDSLLQDFFEKPVFAEALHEGAVSLYALRVLKIDNSLTMNNTYNKSVYYNGDEFYITTDSLCMKASASKRAYYDFFGKTEVKKILKAENLSLKNENDLLRFVKRLNENNL